MSHPGYASKLTVTKPGLNFEVILSSQKFQCQDYVSYHAQLKLSFLFETGYCCVAEARTLVPSDLTSLLLGQVCSTIPRLNAELYKQTLPGIVVPGNLGPSGQQTRQKQNSSQNAPPKGRKVAWLALKCGERQDSLDPSEDWHLFNRHLFISCVFL